MSQQRAKSTNDLEQNTPNANNMIINLDDSDEGEEYFFEHFVRPALQQPTNDLCISPSTSAAAAAAAAAPVTTTPTNAAAGESLKSSTIETATANVASGGADTSASPTAAALECPICLQTCIHPARLPCGHIFCFLCVKGVAYKNRRCAMCRREIPAAFLDHPQLVNGIDDICATRGTEDGYQWYYEGRNGGWWAYDSRTNDDIETAFKAYAAYKLAQPMSKDKFSKPPPVVDWDNPVCTCTCHNHVMLPNYGYGAVYEGEETFEDNLYEVDDNDNDNDDHGYGFVENFDSMDYLDSSSDSSSDYSMQYANDPTKLEVSICGKLYIIDFSALTQTLRSMATKSRSILRRKSSNPGLHVLGVAGIKLN